MEKHHGKPGPLVICAGSFREVCVGRKNTQRWERVQQPVGVEGDVGELRPGEWSSNSQPVTKTEKNYMCCLFREKVFYLQQVEMPPMGFCSPERKPVTQVNRNLAPWEFTRTELRTDIYFLLIVKDNRNSISIATRCLGVWNHILLTSQCTVMLSFLIIKYLMVYPASFAYVVHLLVKCFCCLMIPHFSQNRILFSKTPARPSDFQTWKVPEAHGWALAGPSALVAPSRLPEMLWWSSVMQVL